MSSDSKGYICRVGILEVAYFSVSAPDSSSHLARARLFSFPKESGACETTNHVKPFLLRMRVLVVVVVLR